MSIKHQKIIRFIPIVNLVTVIFWIRMVLLSKKERMSIFTPLLKAFLCIMVITIVRLLIYNITDTDLLTNIVTWVSFYLYDLSLALVFVREQEKNINNIDDDSI